MSEKNYKFEILTPTLCHGTEKNSAEMREPSIRGQLRRWHRLLWGEDNTMNCFGCAGSEAKKPIASKVIVRMLPPSAPQKIISQSPIPHKNIRGTVSGLAEKTKFEMQISYRLINDHPNIPDQVEKTIRLWLLMGTIGQRCTRAFGSVWPVDPPPPRTAEDFKKELDTLLKGKCVYRLSSVPEDMVNMAICTDTLSIPKYFGTIKPSRKPSPLKIKYVKFNAQYFLFLHAPDQEILNGALAELKARTKRLAERF